MAAFWSFCMAQCPCIARRQESQEDSRRSVRGRVVERGMDGQLVGDRLSVVAIVSPEWFVVDSQAFDDRSHRGPLGQLVSRRGQRRVIGDPAGERRRHRDDGVPRGDTEAVGLHLHVV